MLTLALPTGASQAREGTFPTIETLLRPGFVREAMRSLQIALFIIYLAHLTLSEKNDTVRRLLKKVPLRLPTRASQARPILMLWCVKSMTIRNLFHLSLI